MRFRTSRKFQNYYVALEEEINRCDIGCYVQSARPIELIAISAAVIRLSSKPVYQTVALDRRRRIGRTETCGPAMQDEEVHSLAALWTRRGLNVFCPMMLTLD
jgi:hypothetical protein